MKIVIESDLKEHYKLDINITYVLRTNQNSHNLRLPTSVFDDIGFALEEVLEQNKKELCKDLKEKDFEISFTSYDYKTDVISFEISFNEKIIGKYFTDMVSKLLDGWESELKYNNKTVTYIVKDVNAMLRYID